MSYNRGDIYWADVKYEDADVIETRPVLIWSETEMFCVSFKITSTTYADMFRVQNKLAR